MTDEMLVKQAIEMQKCAYAPYSKFPVGAALLCQDGTVVGGCNVESAAYGATICAERAALVAAVSQGRREFSAIAIAGSSKEYCWPCGACRQMLYEFAPQLRVLAIRWDGSYVEKSLEELLPCGFGASTLEG